MKENTVVAGSRPHFSYERTLLFGRFRDELRRHGKKTGLELKEEQEKVTTFKERSTCCGSSGEKFRWKPFLLGLVAQDWLFLALLGILMACVSCFIDLCIEQLQILHLWVHDLIFEKTSMVGLQYLWWVPYTTTIVLTSVAIVAFFAPQAAGSGIPEMKTILRGVILKEYLTWKTLIVKIVGLALSIGSGLPVGKVGPFVHVAAMMASLLSRFVTSFKGIFENESRKHEMLAAACAVGVACTFGAPVGGVLFSIEVTSVYFAVRNYWRGFFSATCSALVFRLLAVAFKKEVTVVAFYRTNFPGEIPFYTEELIPFALIGVLCGVLGALFVYTFRTLVVFLRTNKFVIWVMKKNRYIYPAVGAIFIASLRFPPGYGRYIAGDMPFRKVVNELFVTFTWQDTTNLTTEQMSVVNHWSEHTSIFISLTLYGLSIFFMSIIGNTLPLPAGIFIPLLAIGATIGRLIGEGMYALFPLGLRSGPVRIIPGGYAVVGAAAFAGSATHTVSVCVIVFELTGQFTHMLPVMLAVLIANAICTALQPSIYDAMIKIKKLPYLPDIIPTSSATHSIHVKDIMVRAVQFLTTDSTYGELKQLLSSMPHIRAFPLVDKPDSMTLLGSIGRQELVKVLDEKVGKEARRKAFLQRKFAASVVPRISVLEQIQPNLPPPPSAEQWARSESVASARFKVSRVEPKTSEAGEGRKEEEGEIVSDPVEPNIPPPPPPPPTATISAPGSRTSSFRNLPVEPKMVASHSISGLYNTIGAYMRNVARLLQRPLFDDAFEIQMSEAERKEWETAQLQQVIQYDEIRIDEVPFQLVTSTSLYKVHFLFSLLGLNRAYVTALGRLVGVVALKEIRKALEDAQRGGFIARVLSIAPNKEEASSSPVITSMEPSTIEYEFEPTIGSVTIQSETDGDENSAFLMEEVAKEKVPESSETNGSPEQSGINSNP